MKKSNWLPISMLFLTSIFIIGCKENPQNQTQSDGLPYYNEATFTPNWLNSKNEDLANFHRISPFRLTNQEGQTVTEKTFDSKIYIADFFFTSCPGICPKMTKNMGILQDEFAEDEEILLLSHSVTPERDSVPILKKYADDNGVIAQKWHLVTGTQQEIYKLGRADYFVEEDLGLEKEKDDFLHTENFVLIDKNRHIRGIYNGLNMASIRQLIIDVKSLKKEG